MNQYISIDIETLGRNPEECDIIEFAAVIDDLKTPVADLPKFHSYIAKDFYRGEAGAMAMHSEKLRRITERSPGYDYRHPIDLTFDFAEWVGDYGFDADAGILVAGKNFSSFDQLFLNHVTEWPYNIKVNYRTIDPAMLYFDPFKDSEPPSLGECLARAGLTRTDSVWHTALEDARNVIRCLRFKWGITV